MSMELLEVAVYLLNRSGYWSDRKSVRVRARAMVRVGLGSG